MIIRPPLAALGLLLAGTLAAGCAGTATSGSVTHRAAGEPSRTGPSQDAAAEAYYHYTVAQYHAQGGRFKDAVAAMEEALKRDPRAPFLWR